MFVLSKKFIPSKKDIQQWSIGILGGEKVETVQMSGSAMLVLGIIIAIIIVLIPAFIYIYAWLAAIFLIIGGLVTIMQGR